MVYYGVHWPLDEHNVKQEHCSKKSKFIPSYRSNVDNSRFTAVNLDETSQSRKTLLLRAGMDGTKKYSPPLGIAYCGTANAFVWLFGSRPPLVRGEA